MGRPRKTAEVAEDELVERAKAGDVDAYEEIVRRYQAIVFRIAYVVCRSKEDAEEVAQDAFIKAFAALRRFRSGAPLRPWLLRIAGNEARNKRSSSERRARLPLRLRREAPSGEVALSPEGDMLAAAGRHEVLGALERLPTKQMEVVACRYLLGLSEVEIAAALGCRQGTVKSRLSRALDRLRAEIGEEAARA